MKRHTLAAAVTHEVLARPEALAALMLRHRLTRHDLDLGLTCAATLAAAPDMNPRTAVRGVSEYPEPSVQ